MPLSPLRRVSPEPQTQQASAPEPLETINVKFQDRVREINDLINEADTLIISLTGEKSKEACETRQWLIGLVKGLELARAILLAMWKA